MKQQYAPVDTINQVKLGKKKKRPNVASKIEYFLLTDEDKLTQINI